MHADIDYTDIMQVKRFFNVVSNDSTFIIWKYLMHWSEATPININWNNSQ